MTSTPWWGDLSQTINGIFKGGGPKGILYAGALDAVVERGFWFRAVAGSSAGAITASLIAAGMEPAKMAGNVAEALRQVKKMYLGDLVGSPLVRTAGLGRWLEATLQSQMAILGKTPDSEAPVDFRQLESATGIELYVVAVDVAQRQPVVFSGQTTPHLGVVGAVLASSAIPLAFRPGRLRMAQPDKSEAVHRIMDGGVWANYPAFVFKDSSFRAFHDLPMLPRESRTIGFTLEQAPHVPPASPQQFLDGQRGAEHDRGAGLRGALRNPFVRLYLMSLIPILIVLQAWYTIEKAGFVFLQDWANREWVPSPITSIAGFLDGFASHFSPGLWPVLLFVLAIAVLLGVVGATLLDSAVPATRTLMAVGTNVPYWVGQTEGDNVVRLTVPGFLTVFSFRLKPDQIAAAIDQAKREAQIQLSTILPSAKEAPPSQP